jgi:ABC-type sugar transport system substrate-binding protein
MKGKRKLAGILAAAILLLSAACSNKEPGTEASGGAGGGVVAQPDKVGKTLKVGFTLQDLTIPYFITVINGINAVKADYNVELIVHDGKSDAASQVTAMENFITQGLDCIVAHPIDPVSLEAVTREAQAAGIPVISWSELIKGSAAFLTMNQHEYGYVAGKVAGEWAKEKFPNQADAEVMFVFVPEVEALAERGQGLKDGFLEQVPGATVVAEQAGNTPEAGMKAVETTLIKYPNLNVIVCTNDAVALGANEAMVAAGKRPGSVAIVGPDASEECLKKIRDNTMIVGTVDIGAFDQGILFCKYSRKLVEEGPLSEPIYVNFVPVTRANVGEFLK